MVRPRATVRDILSSPPDRLAIPLVIVATISQFIVENDFQRLIDALRAVPIPMGALLLLASIILGSLVSIALLYGFSYPVSWFGKAIGGDGNPEQIRTALAWGSVPFVWALLFRIPARAIWGEPLVAIVFARDSGAAGLISTSGSELGLFFPILTFVLLEAATGVWYLLLISMCVGEAHGFSAWRGLGSLLLPVFIPLLAIVFIIFTLAGSS